MSKPAALVATIIAIPLVVFGCGGAEWHPVAGPTVIPAAPAPEPMKPGGFPAKKMAKHHDDDAPPAPPPAASASAASSASAKPATSAAKAPPTPPKKK